MSEEEFVRDSAGWSMRFTRGEREQRSAAGEWTGKTIADYARQRADEEPDAVAVTGETGGMTYAQLLDEAQALARGMLAAGVKRGETVSFQLPNWIEAVVVNLACALAGIVVVPVIPIYRQAELRFILKDCRARMLFIPETFRSIDYPQMIDSLRADLPELRDVVVVRGAAAGMLRYADMVAAGQMSSAELRPAGPDEAKFLIYTSGTTGQPKGVIYSHNQSRRPVWASMQVWGINPGARILMPSPVTHVTGYSYGLEAAFGFGIRVTLMEKWDAARAARLIDEQGIEFTISATPFLQDLVEEAERSGTRLPSLRIFACGGAAVPPELIRRANRVFANCRTFRVFGSSECPMVTQGVLDDPELAATTDGRVFDWQVKVVDLDGNRVAPGTEGEILARGPSLFRGYTSAEANRESFDPEGYFRTGDLGVVTADGLLAITGRKKDIIIRGGENLSAKEIEDALHEHPAVREAAVVAMPHDRLGEGVCAWLIASGAARPDQAELADHLARAGLARQKCPERIEYIAELPKTASGKVKKHELRRMITQKIIEERRSCALRA
ncbi:AMP-binding protein [Mesorhizobium sp. 1B3]|uniref:AMP-binding protein n=1 Tax=Mesorhizobium sp. 1B3 TaxID=3243599 RepID=UPI003D951E41